jgi:ABC-2 type transport system permease protein
MASASQRTAVAVDMTTGIVARFRTMPIWQPSLLSGHVTGSVVQAMLGIAVVTGVAVLIGLRPNATPIEWLAIAGLLAGFSLALTWLVVGLGLAAKSVESASNTPMFLLILPFLGSGFVPTDTMPAWLRWFAEHQPFTPLTETLRGLLLSTTIGDSAAQAIGWCIALTVVERRPRPGTHSRNSPTTRGKWTDRPTGTWSPHPGCWLPRVGRSDCPS